MVLYIGLGNSKELELVQIIAQSNESRALVCRVNPQNLALSSWRRRDRWPP